MTRHCNFIVSLCLLAAACSQATPENRSATQSPDKPIVQAASVPRPIPANPAGCSDKIAVALDEKSLIDPATQLAFSSDRLGAFSGKVAAAFHGAADAACRSTPAVRKALAPVHLLTVQSGSGATEATFYRGEQEKAGEIVFQWAFDEAALDVPKRADIESGLRCWADPGRTECAEIGD